MPDYLFFSTRSASKEFWKEKNCADTFSCTVSDATFRSHRRLIVTAAAVVFAIEAHACNLQRSHIIHNVRSTSQTATCEIVISGTLHAKWVSIFYLTKSASCERVATQDLEMPELLKQLATAIGDTRCQAIATKCRPSRRLSCRFLSLQSIFDRSCTPTSFCSDAWHS